MPSYSAVRVKSISPFCICFQLSSLPSRIFWLQEFSISSLRPFTQFPRKMKWLLIKQVCLLCGLFFARKQWISAPLSSSLYRAPGTRGKFPFCYGDERGQGKSERKWEQMRETFEVRQLWKWDNWLQWNTRNLDKINPFGYNPKYIHRPAARGRSEMGPCQLVPSFWALPHH